MKSHNKTLTFKWPARVIAVLVVTLLVFASMLYFYDTLFAALKNLGLKEISESNSALLCWVMASTIGLGIFAESAGSIWNTLIFWGQCADNWLIERFTGQKYFIDVAEQLVISTRKKLNRVNLSLQAITFANCNEEEWKELLGTLAKLNDQCQRIQSQCSRINKILECRAARDFLNRQRQDRAKVNLNTLVTENLQIADRIESLFRLYPPKP